MTFKPTLAATLKPSEVTEPLMVSIKLEGVRGELLNGTLLTRALKPFNNPLVTAKMQRAATLCAKMGIVLEGEFYLHGLTFKEIDSYCRNGKLTEEMELEFHVFDCFIPDKPDLTFHERINAYIWAVNALNNAGGCNHIVPVLQHLCSTPDQVQDIYDYAIENEYEGWVGRKPSGVYKFGRSTKKQMIFVRGKPWETWDGVVLSFNERMENLCESEVNELGYLKKKQDKDAKAPTGMAQSAWVMCPNLPKPIKVVLTRGLTDANRKEIWNNQETYIGTALKFTGMPIAGQELPRSPIFQDWRGDLDPMYLQHDGTDELLVCFDPQEYEAMNASDIVDQLPLNIFLQRVNEQGICK